VRCHELNDLLHDLVDRWKLWKRLEDDGLEVGLFDRALAGRSWLWRDVNVDDHCLDVDDDPR
jgi:hypothetical protein